VADVDRKPPYRLIWKSYTVGKKCTLYFCNIFVKPNYILIIVGTQIQKEICNETATKLPPIVMAALTLPCEMKHKSIAQNSGNLSFTSHEIMAKHVIANIQNV